MEINNSEVQHHIRNLEYVIKEIKKGDRPVKDMDLTLRLHLLAKFLIKYEDILRIENKKKGWSFL